MTKIDYKKELKPLYSPSAKEAAIIKVPATSFLMIDGAGDPATSKEYMDAIQALYPLSYTLKFMAKKSKGIDYGVMPMEGLWWADDMGVFMQNQRDQWKWTSMMPQPDLITGDMVKEAMDQVYKKSNPPALSKVRFELFNEGLSAQIMHIGPYSAEGPTITKLHDFITTKGYERSGKHHEIYLSDPRRSAPEKLKTIVRQPIKVL